MPHISILTNVYLAATAVLAPPSAICAGCGCTCAGDIVSLTREDDRIAGRALPTYRHVDATGCLVARARSEAFWYGTIESEQP